MSQSPTVLKLLLSGENHIVREDISVLVLGRKVGERVLIGENIAVTVVKMTSGGVRLGIEAPPELPVVREELAVKMAAEQAAFAPRPAGKKDGVEEPASTR
jgi:carbon storage regulator